ncbi:hypothetical protein [Photobacterium sanguinicancri]|uniref:hypothetical protein n=1 Tax=Photobacterium sanguinicancri TaxID=875932 RepID=UPI0026E2B35C|nr:hypothetical protein [Photobacterium sanguinicancri]MDO6497318.1 hypothetical protein [Photobacterium sanguinicancri]
MFWVSIIMAVISIAMSYRAMNQSHDAPDAREPQAPVIEEGKTLGVLFGRAKIKSAVVYWWGDVSYREIRK